MECILVDDCGTDCSMKVAELFVKEYHGEVHFHIIHHSQNQGLSFARNSGIKHAIGEYLLFLDSDDKLMPNAIEYFVEQLELHPGIDMIQGAYKSETMEKRNDVVLPEFTNDRKEIKTLMLNYNKMPIMAQNRLVKRQLIETNNLFFKEGIIHEDCYWSFFLAKHISSLVCLKEKTYYYRANPNSITSKHIFEKEAYSFRVIIEDLSANIDPFLRGEQKTIIWYLLLQALECGYYNNEREKEHLFNCLYHECTYYERPLLKICYSLPDNIFMKKRLINMIIRLFRI